MMMMFGVAGRMKERSNDWAGGAGRRWRVAVGGSCVCWVGWAGVVGKLKFKLLRDAA